MPVLIPLKTKSITFFFEEDAVPSHPFKLISLLVGSFYLAHATITGNPHPVELADESEEGHVGDGHLVLLRAALAALVRIEDVILVLAELDELLGAVGGVLGAVFILAVPGQVPLLPLLCEDVGTPL